MKYFTLLLITSFSLILLPGRAQTITGAWKGKIQQTKVEVKIIKSGDSLTGTSYYYTSKNNYKRYAIKGYFDTETNEVVWWDDFLIEDHSNGGINTKGGPNGFLNVADFNCPGNTQMMLDGTANNKESKDSDKQYLHLEKTKETVFIDDWDFVIENYFVGANDPKIIAEYSKKQGTTPFVDEPEIGPRPMIIVANTPPPAPIVITAPSPKLAEIPAPELSANQKKFESRKKVMQTVIPVTSELIEIRFYDNAQVDGDSIALFLNNKMIFEHIRLTENAYTISIKASDLGDDNELVMVAENLGSIPPNTSYMVAIVGDKRYEARLYANENSSAVVRLVKPGAKQ
ncbi:MAG: hypothetical protein K2P88_17830 [Chitinophagaceae bacterium]|uniref:hypothetical protein n=1 Tax=unclassified Paraflavitalea TaxID=2798305 RepID=UPI003D32C38A|nr:hypothetical protein [Chitinophagaceae bacterium]